MSHTVALPHFKWLYLTQYYTYIGRIIKQVKLIFIPSCFPSCIITTRGLVKVFLLCIMAKIISTLREVQASSGGMHWSAKNRVRGQSQQSARTAVPVAHIQFYPTQFTKKMRTSKQPSLLWQSDYNIIQYGVCLWKLKLTLFVLWICIEKINLNHLCNKKQFLFAAIQWHLNSNCTLCSQNVQYNSSYLLKPWA